MNRRQVLERAAVIERGALWSDLMDLRDDPLADEFLDLVARIRLLSEAIGYPSPWPSVPVVMLKWYEAIETDRALGIYAEPIPWAEVAEHLDGVETPDPDVVKIVRTTRPREPDWSTDAA